MHPIQAVLLATAMLDSLDQYAEVVAANYPTEADCEAAYNRWLEHERELWRRVSIAGGTCEFLNRPILQEAAIHRAYWWSCWWTTWSHNSGWYTWERRFRWHLTAQEQRMRLGMLYRGEDP